MSLSSLPFLCLVAGAVVLYTLAPRGKQWWVLLAANVTFYAFCGLPALGYLLFTILTAYAAGRLMERVKEKKRVAAVALVLNFGLLFLAKYWDFTASLLWSALRREGTPFSLGLIMPLGLSFYIFQSMGYVLDCARGKIQPERSLPRFALFVSFFPQLTQGPISRWSDLAPMLIKPHPFEADRLKFGIQRMMWGYFKKIVIADRAAMVVDTVFSRSGEFGGLFTAFGVLFYCIQLYCDFSGGMDIALGVAELFGVTVTENFRRPLFARSLAEYWRRWHITLGTWMRDYVFYPFILSKPFVRLGKWSRRKVGGKLGKVIPTSLATFLVYLLIGLWHGAEVKYIAFGLWNGVLMTAALLMEGPFRAWKKRLNLGEQGWFVAFQLGRTMFLVFLGRYLTRSPSLTLALTLLGKTFRHPCLYQLFDGTLFTLGLSAYDYCVVAVGVLIVLGVELAQERGIAVRRRMETWPPFAQWLGIAVPLLVLLFCGILRDPAISAEFIYQQF